MEHDRTYWRAEHIWRLIEEGKASEHELAIALAERLETVALQLEYGNWNTATGIG